MVLQRFEGEIYNKQAHPSFIYYYYTLNYRHTAKRLITVPFGNSVFPNIEKHPKS